VEGLYKPSRRLVGHFLARLDERGSNDHRVRKLEIIENVIENLRDRAPVSSGTGRLQDVSRPAH